MKLFTSKYKMHINEIQEISEDGIMQTKGGEIKNEGVVFTINDINYDYINLISVDRRYAAQVNVGMLNFAFNESDFIGESSLTPNNNNV